MKHVFVIDDDANIRQLILRYLEKEGYKVTAFENAEHVFEAFNMLQPDALVLDIMMPGTMDGLDLCKKIRTVSQVPIIFVSAKDEAVDRIIGLELGADDYVTKPFSNRELQARVKALLRRTDLIAVENQEEDTKLQSLQIGDLEILPDAYVAKKYGEELDLTHREFELLHHLASHLGQVITREHLLETVWGYDYFGDVRTVDVTIRRLREKIEDTPSRPEYILTRRGVGYYMRNND